MNYFFDAMWAILAVVWGFFLIIMIICYVFYSLGLYTIAKRRNLRYPGLAWVPLVSNYVLGSVSDQYDLSYTGKYTKMRLVLLWFSIVLLAVFIILVIALISLLASLPYIFSGFSPMNMAQFMYLPFLYMILLPAAMVVAIIQYIAIYNVYRSCSPDYALMMLVFSIIFPIIIPFVFFAIRKNDKGMPVYQAPQTTENPVA